MRGWVSNAECERVGLDNTNREKIWAGTFLYCASFWLDFDFFCVSRQEAFLHMDFLSWEAINRH